MRLFPVLIAILVAATIYAFVFERERLTAMLPAPSSPSAPAAEPDGEEAGAAGAEGAQEQGIMRVVVQRSEAREVDSAVVLRGRTEANRLVEVKSSLPIQIVAT